MKLNLGAGDVEIPGFISIDRKLGAEVYPLPYKDGEVEEIRASHVLEHFPFKEVPLVLREWHRVLKPGGIIKIAVPDVEKINSAEYTNHPHKLLWLMGGQKDENDFHKSAFTSEILKIELQAAGFGEFDTWRSEIGDCAALPISLNVAAKKVAAAQPLQVSLKFAAVASVPRLGWQDHFGCIHDALGPHGIRCSWGTGAFWEKCMQKLLKTAVDTGADAIITLDYDTVFTAVDIDSIITRFARNPHIDALASLQPRRNTGMPLCTVAKDGHKTLIQEITNAPFECETAHFGLTVIRATALKKMPYPWLWGQPGTGGDFDASDAVDADIYFWKKFRAVGNKLFTDPSIRVGHLEMMVSIFEDGEEKDGTINVENKHLTINQWREKYQ
jgi:hypothetical protein